jgi:UPF0716 protein FxsA
VLGRLILLFTTIPLLELALLLWIGSRVGVLPTVALILLTGVLGAALARQQGFATWRRFEAALQQGRIPGRELAEGLLILVAGAVLLTPGVLTDAAGFLILVPAVRRPLIDRVVRAARRRMVVVGSGPEGPAEPGAARGSKRTGSARSARSAGSGEDEVIEAEFEVVERDPSDPG